MILNILKTIILGIVEGITEWLPVSSTGHLILMNSIMKLDMSHAFVEMFDVVVQLGAILAVVVIYFRKLWPFHTAKNAPSRTQFANVMTEGAGARFQKFADKYLYMDKVVMWVKILVSVLPAIAIGLPLDDWLDEHLYNATVVALMLILYGVFFILIENRNRDHKPRVRSLRKITMRDALIIGLFQCLAMIPGTSRSGATIIGGILIGMSRTVAAEYTFYLAIPTMFGASALKLLKFVKNGGGFGQVEILLLLIGMTVAFAVSVFTIKFLMNYIRKHDFKVFGWYRIALGVLVLVLGLVHVI
jgi:undecaprenyl-diphosphatase